MNEVVLMGRLANYPEDVSSAGIEITRFSLAVNRIKKKDSEQSADFFNCVCFRNNAKFVMQYITKGDKIVIDGKLRSSSYTNKDGVKVYTVEVICDRVQPVETKRVRGGKTETPKETTAKNTDGFMQIPDGLESELPFT